MDGVRHATLTGPRRHQKCAARILRSSHVLGTPTRPPAGFSQTFGSNGLVTSVPLGEARNRLSVYIADVERTHQRVLITRHGHPAAVLISPEDLTALEETVDILASPGAPQAISEGLTDLESGRVADNDAIRARFTPG